MLKEIIYGIAGYFLGTLDSRGEGVDIELNKDDIPPFSRHFVNAANCASEDWYLKEPMYRKRYVNIVDKQSHYVISIDWYKKDEAIDYCICDNQQEAEFEVEMFKIEYGAVIEEDKDIRLENVQARYFIYTINRNIDINIKITDYVEEEYDENYHHLRKEDNFEVIDFIKCLDKDEALELAYEMRDYYKKYKYVEVYKNYSREPLKY